MVRGSFYYFSLKLTVSYHLKSVTSNSNFKLLITNSPVTNGTFKIGNDTSKQNVIFYIEVQKSYKDILDY